MGTVLFYNITLLFQDKQVLTRQSWGRILGKVSAWARPRRVHLCRGKSGGVGWLDLKGQDADDQTLLGGEHVPLFKKGGLHNEPVGSH